MKKLIALILLLVSCQLTRAQDLKLIQFSGVVLTADSIHPIPYATITIVGKNRGTNSDVNGFFSFVAETNDSLLFSAIGYKSSYYHIPGDLKGTKYSLIKLLTSDTINLPVTEIHPFPSKEIFDYMFVNLHIPDDDLERARKNLEREKMKEERDAMGMDARENQLLFSKQQFQKFYHAGQIPPMNIMSPIAWSQFFTAWKRGDFKKKK